MDGKLVTSRPNWPISRWFGLAALFAGLAALLFGATVYWMYAHEKELLQRVVLATADADGRWAGVLLTQTLDHEFGDYLAAKSQLPQSFVFDAKALRRIDQLARSFATRTPIAKIKIYNAEGRTIYSTSPVQIDEPNMSVLALQDALSGKTVSVHERRDSFAAVDGIRSQVRLVSTYMPYAVEASPSSRVDLVVETYVDITKTVDMVEAEIRDYLTRIVLTLGGLFVILSLLVLQGVRMMARMAQLRARATETIAESETLLSDGVESMTDAFIMVDAEFRVALWNRAYLRFFPHLAGVIHRGMPWRDIVAANVQMAEFGIAVNERAARVDEIYRRITSDASDSQARLADGRTWLVATRPMANGGRVQTIRDVTVELTAQAALAEAKKHAEENEGFFREAVESMTDGFVLLDADKRVVFWNSRYPALLPPIRSVLRRGAHLRELVAALPASSLYNIAPAGREAWIESALPRLWDGPPFIRPLNDGRFLRIAGTPTATGGRILALRDVTDDVQAKEKIARLALVAEKTDNAVVVSDASGRIEWVNSGFTQLSGYEIEEVLGRRAGQFLLGPGTATETNEEINAAMRAGEGFDVEILHYSKSGKPYWVQIAGTPVGDESGVIRRYIVIGLEITARKEQEQRLAQALARERELVTQQKGFIAVAAHEFRTPLTIIDGASQRLARHAEQITPEDIRERASRIRTAVSRMSELIDTTLNTARLDDGRIEIDAALLDLVELVAGVARRMGGAAPEFEIVVEAIPPSIQIEADANLMEQVFTNLISNAIKYSGRHRRIDVAVVRRDARAVVTVRDYGIGIPADELPKLFRRFFRASTAKGLPGTGIGLNLARELVTLQGGEVAVESVVGAGSVFTVTLPVAAARPLEVAD